MPITTLRIVRSNLAGEGFAKSKGAREIPGSMKIKKVPSVHRIATGGAIISARIPAAATSRILRTVVEAELFTIPH
jgi:hypothetical protein